MHTATRENCTAQQERKIVWFEPLFFQNRFIRVDTLLLTVMLKNKCKNKILYPKRYNLEFLLIIYTR